MSLSKREIALYLKAQTVESDSGCWEWQAGKHGVGYGCCNKKYGGNGYAHRAMVEAIIGPIPPKMHVMHSCDNRKCINPAHLSWATQQENIADAVAKGRAKGGSLPNEKNPFCKFSNEQIERIRQAKKNGMRFTHIMREFGVSESHLIRIIRHEARSL